MGNQVNICVEDSLNYLKRFKNYGPDKQEHLNLLSSYATLPLTSEFRKLVCDTPPTDNVYACNDSFCYRKQFRNDSPDKQLSHVRF